MRAAEARCTIMLCLFQRICSMHRLLLILGVAIASGSVAAVVLADSGDGSLLGQPVTSLLRPLDEYEITVSQAKGSTPRISVAAAKYALTNSQLIDPTLGVVRNNAFPLLADLTLRDKKSPTSPSILISKRQIR